MKNQTYMLISSIVVIVFSSACSFSNKDQTQSKGETSTQIETMNVKEVDSDGDFITDSQETELGRNPVIANLPVITSKFLQNYKINISSDNISTGEKLKKEIIANTDKTSPDFKYRVGKRLIKEKTLKKAAENSRFSSHTWGKMSDYEFNWNKYPEIDPEVFHKAALEIRPVLNEQQYNARISINFKNSIKLKKNTSFSNIKNIKVNFYYYDYENESFETIKTQTITRTFNAGVVEQFETKLDNVPLKLLSDNYFKKGEFIFSEIVDYEIPELKTTYSKLINSIKSKTISVAFNTPLESTTYYVSTNQKRVSFNKILKTIFKDNFKIKEDKLTKIGQFENSLENYKDLNDLASKDKKGNWFVLTTQINEHYLDYLYANDDKISIIYALGSELARQNNNKVYSYSSLETSEGNYRLVKLGKADKNSTLSILIAPKQQWGLSYTTKTEEMHNPYHPPHPSAPASCTWEIRTPKRYHYKKEFKKNSNLDELSFIIDNKEYSMAEMIEKNYAETKFSLDKSITIKFSNIGKLSESAIGPIEIYLKLKSKSHVFHPGLKLVYEKPVTNGRQGCPHQTQLYNCELRQPISTESLRISQIRSFSMYVHNRGCKLAKFASPETAIDQFSIAFSSTITNRFN